MGGPVVGLGNQLGGLGDGCGVRHDSVQGDHRDTLLSLPIVQARSIPFHTTAHCFIAAAGPGILSSCTPRPTDFRFSPSATAATR